MTLVLAVWFWGKAYADLDEGNSITITLYDSSCLRMNTILADNNWELFSWWPILEQTIEALGDRDSIAGYHQNRNWGILHKRSTIGLLDALVLTRASVGSMDEIIWNHFCGDCCVAPFPFRGFCLFWKNKASSAAYLFSIERQWMHHL